MDEICQNFSNRHNIQTKVVMKVWEKPETSKAAFYVENSHTYCWPEWWTQSGSQMRWLLALGRLLSMTQTGCWEAQPGNEAFGKVAGGTKAFQGFNKRFAGRHAPFLPTKAVQVVTSWLVLGVTRNLGRIL